MCEDQSANMCLPSIRLICPGLYSDQALSSSLVLKMSKKEDFKGSEAMTERKQTFHPVNLSLS